MKGDLSNLLLRFPDLNPADFEAWVEREREDLSTDELLLRAQQLATRHGHALRDWGLGETEVAAYCRSS